jgi:hypothetical protein
VKNLIVIAEEYTQPRHLSTNVGRFVVVAQAKPDAVLML